MDDDDMVLLLRAYLAGQALAGLGNWTPYDGMVRSEFIDAVQREEGTAEYIRKARALWAVAQADALLAALDEGEK